MKRHNRHSPNLAKHIIELLHIKNPELNKDKFGRKCCKMCNELIPKGSGRRAYCGQECLDKYRIGYPETPRELCYLRDKGVCCNCGLDTEELTKYHMLCGDVPAYRSTEVRLKHIRYRFHPKTSWTIGRLDAVTYQLEQMGANTNRNDLWDMNHIIGVELYTGEKEMLNDLNNLETLCIPCHRVVTANQAKDRAKRKKRNKKMGPKERAMREQRENQ